MTAQLNAINAYQQVGQQVGNFSNAGVGATPSGDFANMVNNVIDETANSVQHGERMASASLVGDVSLEELAVAVNNAEVALKTVVAVRDRMISAYQDIMKMPI